jgi:hypothetical protein
MDQVTGATWQKTGEVTHPDVRPCTNGCVATGVGASLGNT